MFCPKCGKEIADDAEFCVHCGRKVPPTESSIKKSEQNEPKTAIGVLFALFLGLIGLIIGICIYPEGTVARKTFIKGWMITYFISLGAILIIFAIYYGVASSSTPYYY